MGKLQEFKIKKYAKMQEKYPNVEYVYRTYKLNNLSFHESHKLTSWKFLSKLISADKAKKDLTKIPFPKGTYNPFCTLNINNLGKIKPDLKCKAIPDSKLLNRLEPKKLVEELSKYDVISFDIFDTCIFRPFANPTDLFYLLGAKLGVINFSELRRTAEGNARRLTKKPNFEVDIYDIYEDLSKRCFLTKDDANQEIELEKQVCYANPYMLEVFKELRKNKNKILLATSDMYLPSKVIKEILEKNGFVGFDEIFVSCEHGFNKSCGQLFQIEKEKYNRFEKFIHIGDNFESDIRGAQKAGIKSCFYEQCNAFGNKFRPQTMISPTSLMYKGVVNNYLYNGTTKSSAREDFGFLYAGPIVSGYIEFINKFVKSNDLDYIMFLARDMDIFYKVYNKFYKEYENTYASTSRFALQEIIATDFTDEYIFHTVKSRCNRGYTIKKAFNEINLDFLCSELEKYGLNENDYIVPDKILKIETLIKNNIKKVGEHFSENEEACKKYFEEKLAGHRRICLVDLGWRGSILAYLKYLLVQKWNLCDEVDGVLFGATVNDASMSFMSQKTVTPYAYSHLNNRDYMNFVNYESEYINVITIESIFTSKEPSLLEYGFDKDKKTLKMVYGAENRNKQIINEFHSGIIKFVKEFEKHRKPFKEFYPISAVDAYEPLFKIAQNKDYIARIVGDVVDTPFAIAGLNIKEEKYVTLGELMLERKLIDKWPIE